MKNLESELAIVVPAYNEERVIERALTAIYQQSDTRNILPIVVNNASTDNMQEVVAKFCHSHEDFPLVTLYESQKGTGCAADSGFRFAAEQGCHIIARTDADSAPRHDWSTHIKASFEYPNLRLVGGKRVPLHDHLYRRLDSLLWPVGIAIAQQVKFLKEKMLVDLG